MWQPTEIAAWVGAFGAFAAGIMAVTSEIRRKKAETLLRKEAKETEERLRRENMRDVYSSHISTRDMFWEKLRSAYTIFLKERQDGIPADLHKLVDRCGMPPGLDRFEYIKHYSLEGGTKDQEGLMRFAESIYPEHCDTKENPCINSIIQAEDFKDWNNARSVLGDFWDKWANRLGTDYIYTHSDYQKDRRMIILLSWLDITHRKQKKDLHVGKKHMFAVGTALQHVFQQEFS